MRLKRVHVKNFRSIRDAEIELGQQTAILGANGTGKSTFLRAIDRFYGQSTSVEWDDFHGRNTGEPIEIALTFCDFNEAETATFGSRIHNNEMTVVRVFEANGGKNNGRYYGVTLQFPGFHAIRAGNGAQGKRDAYKALRDHALFSHLPPAKSADEVMDILLEWEAENRDQCRPSRDDGQFFGFTNVAKGALQKSTNFVFIPAVRDASADAVDSRGAVIAKLMELVVRSAVQQREDIKLWRTKTSNEYRELTDPAKIKELSGLSNDLTQTLQVFYAEAGVSLQWKSVDDLNIPLPNADVLLQEDGFEGPVDKKGHGLQRAFILTLLQHLARASSEDAARQTGHEEGQFAPSEAADDASIKPDAHVMPGLILAIEEPELYQHPTKQRHFAKVLTQLSDGSLPGVAAQTQIIFASHSSLFVSLNRFEEVRLARRQQSQGRDHKACVVTCSTLADIAKALEQVWQKPAGSFSAESLRPRLHVMGTEIAEGFFADGVVLVEGTSDRAAIHAAAQLKGVDLEALGLAVLPVEGKSKLDKPALIFKSLNIPTYIIWDCDSKDGKIKGENSNKALMRISGCPEAEIVGASTRVHENYACFERDLESMLKQELGADDLSRAIEKAKVDFEMEDREDVLKAPFAMTKVLETLASEGRQSQTLNGIVEAIIKIRTTPQPAPTDTPELQEAA